MEDPLASLIVCPHCRSAAGQVKAGKHGSSQRYKCTTCRRRYTPGQDARSYPEETRRQARALAAQGQPARQIARQLGLSAQTVLNWLADAGAPESAAGADSAGMAAKRKATINDVAARAGVSVATVSNYLNHKGRMAEATRTRIQAAVKELYFTPSALMRGLHRRRTHILGVMMFDLSALNHNVGTAIAPQLMAGINAAAGEAAHNILLYTGVSYRPDHSAGAEFLDGHIDGLIWVSREIEEPVLERVAAAGLPTVALLTRQVPPGVGYVQADNIAGAVSLVEHLAGRGHRRIAYVGAARSWSLQERRDGYRQGLQSAGLPFMPEYEIVEPALWHSEEAHVAAVDRLLALPEPPTAIMVQYDRYAATVLRALEARGVRIPEDIAVTGFDDTPDAHWLGGGLTTVRQPFSPMGELAVQSLIRLIEGAPAEACRHLVPVELIHRATSGHTAVDV